MATGESDEPGTGALAYLAPLVVLAVVLGTRIGVGMVADRPTHEITLVAATAGTLGASAVLLTGSDAYGAPRTPTMRLLERVSPRGPTAEYRRVSRLLVLFAGTVAGGAFPTVLNRVLGVPGKYFAGFPHALAGAALWSVAMFVLALAWYLLVGALSLSESDEIQVFAEFFVVYAVPFALVVALSRLVWFRLLGV